MSNYSVILFSFFLLLTYCSQKKDDVNTTSSKPNFIFILADDLGYHDLSVMGSKYYETPNIDRIANEGMTFTEGYATCQVCSPSVNVIPSLAMRSILGVS